MIYNKSPRLRTRLFSLFLSVVLMLSTIYIYNNNFSRVAASSSRNNLASSGDALESDQLSAEALLLSTDTAFESYLTAQGFPDSYKPYLRDLHDKYPNWVFKAVKTGLNWNDAVANEVYDPSQSLKNQKSMIYGSGTNPRYNLRNTSDKCYSYILDTFYPCDSSTFFVASDDAVKYYMDPRTYLNSEHIFAFESLTYDSTQTRTGINAILSGSFMAGTAKAPGYNYTYSGLIYLAAQASGVSAYHLASRIKQEVGLSYPGTATCGTNSSYPGIYNFYNIGAYASPNGSPAVLGLSWASSGSTYLRPWNTRYKSIKGGALYLAQGYIAKGQNTIYTQKFNVTNTSSLYGHQYMGNIEAPYTEGAKVYKAYTSLGMLNKTLTFNIPVYTNLPAKAITKPAENGNPNNYLKTLSVSGYSLTPKFSVSTTKSYSLNVAANVTSVNITATTINSSAAISGTGTKSLSPGENTFTLKVTAGNGATRNYTITVTRAVTPSYDTDYYLSGRYISGITPGTTANEFVKLLNCTNGTAKVTIASGTAKTTDMVGTGDKVTVTVANTTSNYLIVIYGDLDGDGSFTAKDLLKLTKHLQGISSDDYLSGAYLAAANIKRSGSISDYDLYKLQQVLNGAETIEQ